MKLFRGLALLCALTLSTTAVFAAQTSAPAPAPDNVCVDVYCDGVFAGKSCGQTTPDIIQGAQELCAGT